MSTSYNELYEILVAPAIEQVDMAKAQLDLWLPIYEKLSERLKKRFAGLGYYFDLDKCSREEVLEAMELLKAGKWKKSNSSAEGCLDYSAEINGVTVRLWGAAPPGSCRMVELIEEVPAQPATTRVVRKLICSGDEAPAAVEATNDDSIPF